jgi:hypothetical protein
MTEEHDIHDIAAELSEAHKTIKRLEAKIISLMAGDKALEISRLTAKANSMDSRCKTLAANNSELLSKLAYYNTLLGKIRKLLNVERNDMIETAIIGYDSRDPYN